MKYQLVADNPMEETALQANPVVRTLFDPFLPVLQARAIIVAARTGLFEALSDVPQAPTRLAHTLGLDEQALRMLLRVLAAAGYVDGNDDDEFRLSELARATLQPDSPAQLSAWVQFNAVHWRILSGLEELLRTGRGLHMEQCLEDDSEWALQQRAMLETARPAAPVLAALVPIREGATRMLDVGGSHGLYAAMICRAHPPLQAEVLELPQAVEHARKLAEREGIDDVVCHRCGDVLEEDLGRESCDAVLLGNVVHHFDSTVNRKLLRRFRTALRPGGTIAIWDFRRPDPGAAPDLVGDGLALFFRLTSMAQVFTTTEYTGWLEETGFVQVECQHPTPSQVLVTGRVPSDLT